MTDSDPALRHTASAGSPSALLALGLREDAPDAATLAAALPQYDDFRPLGAGGMGVVWSARHVQLDRRVAVKLLRPDLANDPSFAERFAREARALGKLQHPGIVGVHDFGEVLGLCFLVMEYVDGTDLRSAMRTGLSTEQALAIVPQLCDALQYAHEQGVVHRDIKPENILLDRHGRVKIADFGLAKLREPGEPSATSIRVLGTPHYMAPEQIADPGGIDHRADIFALGVVLYEMLTGKLPVGRFDPPSRLKAVDVRLDDVVLRSLEHDRERRYQHASEVKDRVIAIAPAPNQVRPTTDEVERRTAEEARRAGRWGGIAAIGYFAITISRGFYWDGAGTWGYARKDGPIDLLGLGVLLVLWVISLYRDAQRNRGTIRATVIQLKLTAVWCGIFLGLFARSAWKGADFVSDGGFLLVILAVYSGYSAWTKAVEHGIPARLVFGPRWWIHRFAAEHTPRA